MKGERGYMRNFIFNLANMENDVDDEVSLAELAESMD